MGIMAALAGIGALGQVSQVLEARKTRKDQERAAKAQVADAKAAAKIDRTKDKIGADIRLGTKSAGSATTQVVPTGIGTQLL